MKRRTQRPGTPEGPGTKRAIGRMLAVPGALIAIGLAAATANAGTYDSATAWTSTVTYCPPQSAKPLYSWEMGISANYNNVYDYWDAYDATSGTWALGTPEHISTAQPTSQGYMQITGSTTATGVLVETIDVFYITDGQPSLNDPVDAQATLHLPQDLTVCPSPSPSASPQPSPSPSPPSPSPLPSPSPTPIPMPSPSPTPIASPTSPPTSHPTASPTSSNSTGGTTAAPSQSTSGPTASSSPAASSSPVPSPTSVAIPPSTRSGSGSPPGGGTPWWVFGALGGLVAASGVALGGRLLLRYGLGWLPWFARN
jgi:hypothetical protein